MAVIVGAVYASSELVKGGWVGLDYDGALAGLHVAGYGCAASECFDKEVMGGDLVDDVLVTVVLAAYHVYTVTFVAV